MKIIDNGPNPTVVNIDRATDKNNNYRATLWTGKYLQVTLMTIPPKGEVGLEVHPDTDQFFRVESGNGKAVMGPAEKKLIFEQKIDDESVILIPAGTWHNILNTEDKKPLRLYSIYAPAHHPHGTMHATKADSDADEEH